MPLGETVERLAGKIVLHNLTLELNAVCAMPNHGLPSFEKPGNSVNALPSICPPAGAHSNQGSILGSDAILLRPCLDRTNEASLEQVDLSATVHLTFHELEFCDPAFGLPV